MYKITEVNVTIICGKTAEPNWRAYPAGKTIIYPNTIKKISNVNAPTGSDILENIVLPESVTSIESSAFYECTNLSEVYFNQTT